MIAVLEGMVPIASVVTQRPFLRLARLTAAAGLRSAPGRRVIYRCQYDGAVAHETGDGCGTGSSFTLDLVTHLLGASDQFGVVSDRGDAGFSSPSDLFRDAGAAQLGDEAQLGVQPSWTRTAIALTCCSACSCGSGMPSNDCACCSLSCSGVGIWPPFVQCLPMWPVRAGGLRGPLSPGRGTQVGRWRPNRHSCRWSARCPAPTCPTTDGGVTGIGYGWLGTKQRGTLKAGLTLMGARLYNRSTGLFQQWTPSVEYYVIRLPH